MKRPLTKKQKHVVIYTSYRNSLKSVMLFLLAKCEFTNQGITKNKNNDINNNNNNNNNNKISRVR